MHNQYEPGPTGPSGPHPGAPRMLQPGTGRSKTAPASLLRILGILALVTGVALLSFGVVWLVGYLTDDVHSQRFSDSTSVVLAGGEERTVWIDGPTSDNDDEYPPVDTCRVLGPDQQPVTLSAQPRSKMTNSGVTARTVGTFQAGPAGGEYTVECDGHKGRLTDPPDIAGLVKFAFSIVGGFLLILWSVFLLLRRKKNITFSTSGSPRRS